MQTKTNHVFTYGTLMYPDVMYNLVQHKYDENKALLKGYARKHVKKAVYPGIVSS